MRLKQGYSVILILLLLGCSNCSVLIKEVNKNSYFNGHLTGIALYDPETGENVHSFNDPVYFTPASTTKLLSVFAGLKILGDSVPQLIYQEENDTIYFTGTGDPSFLHPSFNRQNGFDHLNSNEKVLVYVPSDFKDEKFAPGWAWEDYQYYYQPERSSFPLYANSVSFIYDSLNRSFECEPEFFEDFTDITTSKPEKYRDLNANIFSFAPDTSKRPEQNRIPFITSDELVIKLLEDTLHRPVNVLANYSFNNPDTIFNLSSKAYYAYTLKKSDNFFAEQLLYICATELGMPLESKRVRNYLVNRYMRSIRDQPKWVDGSGLSRYNLITPAFLIELLKLINDEISIDEMKAILATGGVDGTLRDWYRSDTESPYVFAKTGTLSNNHSLAGIIRTKSKRNLFFSFMNNHYMSGSAPVKEEMEKILEIIREKY